MIRKINFQFLIIVLFLLTTCKNADKKEECGCNGIIQFTIPDNEPIDGFLSYKIQLDTLDNFYNDKYWVGYTDTIYNLNHSFIICNEEIIPLLLKDELISGKQILVKFSGDVTNTCIKTFSPPEYTYNHIILTKIEKK